MSNIVYTTNLHKIRSMRNRIKVVQGGSSSSKSFSILMILIDKAIRNPGREISCVAMTYPHLRRGIIKDFLKIMQGTGRYIDAHWNKSNATYTFANGSYIEFWSVEDEAKVRGARRTDLFVNEANTIPQETFDALEIRTSDEIWLDFNPTNRFWAHTDLVGKPDVDFIKLTYRGNEGLPATIVRALESKRLLAATSAYWENWTRVYLDGEIGQLEGAVFNNWTTIDTIPEEAQLISAGLDLGFSTDPTALVAIYRYNDSIILDEIVYERGLLTGTLATRIKTWNPHETVYADSADPRTIAELRQYGCRIKPVKKPKIAESIHLMQEYAISVTTHSDNLIKEMTELQWSDKKANIPMPGGDHAIDAARYGIWMRLGKYENRSKTPFRIG
jgi:phage terminase large subunit